MKAAILLATLAVLAVAGAVVRGPTSRTNLQVGYVRPGDRLLNRSYLVKYAIPNAVQNQDMIYRGNGTTRISAIFATEVGYTQYGTAWVTQGGVGWNSVTLRVQSARGWGYYYMVEIWGR